MYSFVHSFVYSFISPVSFSIPSCVCKCYFTAVISMAVKHGPCLLTEKKKKKKRIQSFETKCLWKLLCISYLEHNLWVRRSLLWQLSRDGNVHGSGMSHATTASPKPSFSTPCKVDDAVVGRRNADAEKLKTNEQTNKQTSKVN